MGALFFFKSVGVLFFVFLLFLLLNRWKCKSIAQYSIFTTWKKEGERAWFMMNQAAEKLIPDIFWKRSGSDPCFWCSLFYRAVMSGDWPRWIMGGNCWEKSLPRCFNMCSFNSQRWVKALLHRSHTKGFSPGWTRWWVLRELLYAKHFLHWLHI